MPDNAAINFKIAKILKESEDSDQAPILHFESNRGGKKPIIIIKP